MLHGYKPLHLPDVDESSRARVRRFLCIEESGPGGSLVKQLKGREPVPGEVWGADPARQRLAAAIGEAAKDEVRWPNANFVPEDPFVLVACPPDEPEDFDATCVMPLISELLGWKVGRDLLDELGKLTLGEVVDVLLERSPGYRERVRLASPAPLTGSDALEAHPCPSLASFLDLRAFVATWELDAPRRATQPSTRIRRALPSAVLKQLDSLVRERFGVDPHLSDTAGDDASFASCLGLVAALCGGVCWWAVSTIIGEGWGWYLVIQLPQAIIYGAAVPVLLYMCLGKAWSALRQFGSRITRALGIGKRPRIVTFADLVRWIEVERAKLARCSESSG